MPSFPVYPSRRTALKAGGAALLGAGAAQLPAAQSAAAMQSAPAAQSAEAAAPDADTSFVIGCDTWDARPPAGPLAISSRTTRKIVVHHTAFANTTDYSRDAATALAHKIQDLHMDENGWTDTGNHFTVSRGGYVLEGRHRSLEALRDGTFQVAGAHCVGENTQAVGIENEGTYITEQPTEKLWLSLVRLCTAVCRQYGLGAQYISGHWDWNDTQCPGAAFYARFPLLRLQVAQALGQTRDAVPDRTWPDVFSASAGATVVTLTYLLREQGYDLPVDTKTFTPETVAAVQDFQTQQGIETVSDGTVTGPTWEALGVSVRPGDEGDAVRAVQSILAHKLFALSVTGSYDRATTVAVGEMQRLHGLEETGEMDTGTWCATVGGVVAEEFTDG